MWHDPFFILIVIAVGLVVAVLLTGVTVFALGGELNRKYANKLMRARVITQAVAIVLIVLFAIVRRGA